MLIFIDTEFTDFVDIDLISIAVVSDDDRRFYAERSDFKKALCTSFVMQTVLPLLGSEPSNIMTLSELGSNLRSWLSQFESEKPVLCFDHVIDFGIFRHALGNDVPDWLGTRNIKGQLSMQRLEHFFVETGLTPHHALNDALGNRYALRRENEGGLLEGTEPI